MAYVRLTPAHPTYGKVQQLFDLMDQLGLYIEIDSYGRLYVETKDGDSVQLLYSEASAEGGDATMSSLPPALEWKLVKRKD